MTHTIRSIDPEVVDTERPREGRWRVFDLLPAFERPKYWRSDWTDKVVAVWVSEVYIVQVTRKWTMDNGRLVFALAVRRINEREISSSWSEMAAIVAEVVGNDVWACEFFPPARKLSCVAPMRWFWVLPDGDEAMPVGLHRHGIVGEVAEDDHLAERVEDARKKSAEAKR